MGKFDPKGLPNRSFSMSKMRFTNAYHFLHHPAQGDLQNIGPLEKARYRDARTTYATTSLFTSFSINEQALLWSFKVAICLKATISTLKLLKLPSIAVSPELCYCFALSSGARR